MINQFKKIYFQCKDLYKYGSFSNEEFIKIWNTLLLNIPNMEIQHIKEYSIIGLIAKYTNSNYDNVIQQMKKWESEYNEMLIS